MKAIWIQSFIIIFVKFKKLPLSINLRIFWGPLVFLLKEKCMLNINIKNYQNGLLTSAYFSWGYDKISVTHSTPIHRNMTVEHFICDYVCYLNWTREKNYYQNYTLNFHQNDYFKNNPRNKSSVSIFSCLHDHGFLS